MVRLSSSAVFLKGVVWQAKKVKNKDLPSAFESEHPLYSYSNIFEQL